MVNLITDGALVGFWPMDEPSGAPLWQNHSAAFARHPSGVSFDLTVAVADNTNFEESMSVWPGQGQATNVSSGTTYLGYQVQGHWKLGTDSSPFSRYLLLGAGTRQCVAELWQPAVAQSGFTVGFWVYPNSDGYINFEDDANLISYSWATEAARAHGLLGAFQATTNDAGYRLGISGARDRGAQFNFTPEAGNQLSAFAFIEQAAGAPADLLDVPIEDGRYTHIAYSFRYIDGSVNQIVLYKDGHVAASGTTSANLTDTNTSLISTSLGRTLGIGNSDNASTAVDEYEATTGWNHLVSGVYFFKRVLDEGEVLDMHERGGMQPTPENLISAVETNLTSDYLVAYCPFMEPGYADVSSNQLAFISNFTMGDATERVLCPGPYGFGASFHNGTNTSSYHAAPSGTCFELLNARSWTIGTWLSLQNDFGRDDNLWMSWGSITNSTASNTLPPATLALNTAGMVGSMSGVGNAARAVLEIYPRGDIDNGVDNLVFNFKGMWEYHQQATIHLSVAYDDSTRGIAVYLNGALAESGTLNHSLTDQLMRLAGSGYPLIFGNGVQDSIINNSTKGMMAGGGIDKWLGPCFLAGKALVEPEVRGIVLSGIVDLPKVYRTRHDPRLVAYWPCSNFQLSDVLTVDEARVWGRLPGHLVRGDAFASDERWYDRDDDEAVGTVFRNDGTAYIDHFGSRTITDAYQISFGNLGITSGVFLANGGGLGAANVTEALEVRSSNINLAGRYKVTMEERDLSAQNIAGEYVVSFEVTPSGNIPAIDIPRSSSTNMIGTNALLFSLGNHADAMAAGDSDFMIFLTSINADNPDPLGQDAGLGGSGITIRVDGDVDTFTAANHAPLVSGILPFGVPTRVLVHTKFDLPYNINGITAGQADFTVSLWIDGTLVHRRTMPQVDSKIWSNSTVDSATDSNLIQIGGEIGDDTLTSQVGYQAGLGDIYMREIFVMRGIFHKDEIAALAASGIQTPVISQYVDKKPTTQISIADSDLRGYWRFNGFAGGGSGTTDLSGENNHLFPAAETFQKAGLGITQSAAFLRMAPAMFAESTIGVQCSGIYYSSRQPTGGGTNYIAPFMVSGVAFDDPNAGFSVGFYLKKKNVVTTNRADVLLAYGVLGTNSKADTGLDSNRGWIIGYDDFENVRMTLSTGGNLYLNNAANAATSGQVTCGIFGEGGKPTDQEDTRIYDRIETGTHRPPRLDAWSHYCWTYDPSDDLVRCYVNGSLVDQCMMKSATDQWAGIQVPGDPVARYITFLQHTNGLWDFNSVNLADFDSVLTDVFYFSRAITQGEVAYIAENGIDDAIGTPTSGIIGGFVHGQDTGSGIVGGYFQGMDDGSGIIGAYITGGALASGFAGGYISGVAFGIDTIGGLIYGAELLTGTVGGLIIGSDVASGILGGYILGGLQGNFEFDGGFTVEALSAKDFDAQVEIAKTASSDFDAKLIIFQDEVPPLVDIIVPDVTVSGLVPPFNQYFVGVASGQQGKTISKTRWNFSDFTPTVSVAESGAGFYPVLHNFAASGFYIVRFEAIDSDGLHRSATRIVNAASGIDPVIVSLSGVPRSGDAGLVVDFSTDINILPPGVSITAKLLQFDDGQTTSAFSPTHVYTEPGSYRPIWCVRDSRGVTWCDSLEAGNDFLENGGG